VQLNVEKGVVTSCAIRGDFLGITPIRALEERLEKISFDYQIFNDALEKIELSDFLGGITRSELLSCIFERNGS